MVEAFQGDVLKKELAHHRGVVIQQRDRLSELLLYEAIHKRFVIWLALNSLEYCLHRLLVNVWRNQGLMIAVPVSGRNICAFNDGPTGCGRRDLIGVCLL